jgi:hypothetical protein
MSSLLNLALSVLATSTRNSALAGFAGQMATAVLVAGFGVLLTAAGLGCACAALWIALIPPLGPVGAPLIVAGVCLASAGILTLVAISLMRRARPRVGDIFDAEGLLGEASRYVNEHKGAALLAAALAGVIAGNSSRRR